MNNDQNTAKVNKVIGGIIAIAVIAIFFLVLNWYRGGTLLPAPETPQEDFPPFGEPGGGIIPPTGGGDGGGGGNVPSGNGEVKVEPPTAWAVFDTPKGEIKVSTEKINNPVEKIPGDRGGITDRTDAYTILYFDNQYGRSFLISITSEDTGGARKQAERVFLNTFKITEEQACALPVSVATPIGASVEHGGKELGLSFCLGSVQL